MKAGRGVEQERRKSTLNLVAHLRYADKNCIFERWPLLTFEDFTLKAPFQKRAVILKWTEPSLV